MDRRRGLGFGAFAAALALAGVPAHAEQWTIAGSLAERLEFSDNILLTAQDRQAVFGSITMPRMVLTRRSETSTIEATTEIRGNHYFGNSDLDGVEPRFFLQGSHTGLRVSWGGGLGYTRELARRAELIDTGLATNHGWRITYQAQPNVQFQLTPLDALSFGLGYVKRDYQGIPLIGYHSYSSFLEWTHAASPRLTWIASANGTYYRSDDVLNSRVKMIGVQAGLAYEFSQALSARLTAGERWVSGKTDRLVTGFPINPQQGSSFGALFAGKVTYEAEFRRLSLSVNRAVEPSGFGTTLQSDTIRGDMKQRLTRNIWLGFLGYYQQSQRDSSGSGSSKRKYYTFGPALHWDFWRNWSLVTEYRYRNQSYSSSGRDRYSNTIDVTLQYGLGEFPFEP